MRRMIFVSLVALGIAGCTESTSPSGAEDEYALVRIGAQTPPIPLGESGGAPFLLADTLRLDIGRPRDEDGRILQRVLVIRDAAGVSQRTVSEHVFAIENGVLTYDTCPRGAFCLGSLVYAPRIFQIVRDSLYETGPQASPLPGAVYAAVR